MWDDWRAIEAAQYEADRPPEPEERRVVPFPIRPEPIDPPAADEARFISDFRPARPDDARERRIRYLRLLRKLIDPGDDHE